MKDENTVANMTQVKRSLIIGGNVTCTFKGSPYILAISFSQTDNQMERAIDEFANLTVLINH